MGVGFSPSTSSGQGGLPRASVASRVEIQGKGLEPANFVGKHGRNRQKTKADKERWARRDLNPHGLLHMVLSHAPIPVRLLALQ